jgi:hypothetical protein
MGIRILAGKYDGTLERACMVDSVTGTAFGPLFDSGELAEDFVTRYAGLGHADLRTLTDAELKVAVDEWEADLCPACETSTCACDECGVRCATAHFPSCSEPS